MVPFPFLLLFLLLLLIIIVVALIIISGPSNCIWHRQAFPSFGKLLNFMISCCPSARHPLTVLAPSPLTGLSAFFFPQRLQFPRSRSLAPFLSHSSCFPWWPPTLSSFQLPSTCQQISRFSWTQTCPAPGNQSSYTVDLAHLRCSWPGWPHWRLSQLLTL